jgi:hypothetical protein
MFGRDYPHPEGTWPNTLEWLQASLAGVDETEVRQILGLNAIECFGLDRAMLASIAERIGPDIRTITEPPAPVSPELIENFDNRGGFLRSEADINVNDLAAVCDEVEASLA